MRFVLAAAAAFAALTAAFALPAGAHVSVAGPQCGGTLWKLMTLRDAARRPFTGRRRRPASPTSRSWTAPAKITTSRSAFEKQVWEFTTVLQSYRMASNGEIVFQLFDVPTSSYMNAYLPSAACLPRRRAAGRRSSPRATRS